MFSVLLIHCQLVFQLKMVVFVKAVTIGTKILNRAPFALVEFAQCLLEEMDIVWMAHFIPLQLKDVYFVLQFQIQMELQHNKKVVDA